MSFGLMIGVLGFFLWWGGYYTALVIAWKAGFRNVGLLTLAGVMGICGCFGIPLLGYLWSEVQKRTFAAIESLPDDAPPPPHVSRYQIAAAVAAVGLVLQILGGNLMPDDDGYDDDGWGSAEEEYEYEPVVDYEPEEPPDVAPDAIDEAWDHWEDDVGDDEEATGEVAAEETDEEPIADVEEAETEPLPSTVRGVFLGTIDQRRAAAILVGDRVSFARRDRGRWPVSILPCAPISLEGEWDDEVFVTTATTELEGDGCAELPRPEVVRSFDAPLAEHAGQYVLMPAPHAETTTRLRFTEELTLPVQAPRGAITRDADYTAVRGVLLDTSAVQRGGGLTLWVLRADDLVGL